MVACWMKIEPFGGAVGSEGDCLDLPRPRHDHPHEIGIRNRIGYRRRPSGSGLHNRRHRLWIGIEHADFKPTSKDLAHHSSAHDADAYEPDLLASH